jgi:hypothetical protein
VVVLGENLLWESGLRHKVLMNAAKKGADFCQL